MKKSYTLEEIRQAFYRKFNESGDLWFPYFRNFPDDEQKNVEVTTHHWEEFCEVLGRVSSPELKKPGTHLPVKDVGDY